MTDFVLTPPELTLLAELVGTRPRQLVWDINAVYVVAAELTVRIEAIAETPDHPSLDRRDEVCRLRVVSGDSQQTFQDRGERDHWYKVLKVKDQISKVEVVRTAVFLPEDRVNHPDTPLPRDNTSVFICDCGVLLTFPSGILPAVQLKNVFGFHNWPEIRLYTHPELLPHLEADYQTRVVQQARL